MRGAREYNTNRLYFSHRAMKSLQGILNRSLTIVEAPMGYGKTTAVREYLNHAGSHVLWQKVHDDSDGSFWRDFSRLFRELDNDRSQSLLQLGFPSDSISLQEALNLLEEIEWPEETVLVIDDYHLVDRPAVNSFIELLVENEINNLHIVLTARFTNFPRIEEMVLKGYLHHITKETLELRPEEIAGYYDACGISLKDKETDYLYLVTEGWISALYLFMLEFVAGGGHAQTTSIYKLLEKSVYTPFPEETKDFLLTMCIFDDFTHEQAVYMWGKETAGKLLGEIIEKNAFVKYDDMIRSYHVHNIFTGFLREALAGKGAAYRQSLYRKAGEWELRNGNYIDARHYFYRCGDFDRILLAIEEDRANSFTNENKRVLITQMAECPQEVKLRHPYALLKYTLHLFVHNESELFGKEHREFRDSIITDAGLDDDLRRRLLGELEFMLSFPAYNDLEKMTAHHQRAWGLMRRPTSILNNKANWTFGSPSVLYMFYRESGKLEEEVEALKEALVHYYLLSDGQGMGAEYVMEAERYFHLGDFDSAEISSHRALHKAKSKEQASIVLCVSYLQTRLALMRGDFARAVELLQSMRQDMTSKKEYHFLHTVEICEGSVWAYLNQKHRIAPRLLEADLTNLRLRFPAWAAFNIMYGRALLIRGEYLKLIGSADHFISIASVFPNLLGVVYTWIYLAAASERVFRKDEAMSSLKRALEIAMPDRVYMPFVENCDFIEPLLTKMAGDGEHRDGIARILELYRRYRQSKERIIQEYFADEKPGLTAREMEIARLAAAGATNEEIGRRLFISSNTVKTALKSVYAKLAVNNRTLLRQRLDEFER